MLYLFTNSIYHCDIKPINAVLEEEISKNDENDTDAKFKLIDAGGSTTERGYSVAHTPIYFYCPRYYDELK